MRGLPIAILAAAGLVIEPGPAAASALRVATPRAAAAARPDQAAKWREIQQARAQRWRNFSDQVVHPGARWEPHFGNRRGVTAPLANLRANRSGSQSPRLLGAPPAVLKVALIRVEFETDRSLGLSTGNGRFDLSNPGDAVPAIDRPPHNRKFFQDHMEALRRYYKAQSYGNVDIQAEVWPRNDTLAYRVSDMADFGPWAFGSSIYPAAVHMLHTFLLKADEQARAPALNDPIPWHTYDGLLIVHAGSDFQSDVNQDSPNDIPTFALTVADSDRVVFPDSTVRCAGDCVRILACADSLDDALYKYCPINSALFVPETANQDNFYGAINALFAHEVGHHLFELADLYNIASGLPVVGFWSLMDTGNLAGATIPQPGGEDIFAVGLLPPSIDPFQRFFVGTALELREVEYDGQPIQLLDSERHPDVRAVSLTADEYLLLENRSIAHFDTLELDQDPVSHVILGPKTPDEYEYDSLLPGWPIGHPYEKKPSGGIVVWHIDQSVITFNTSLRVDEENFGFNTNPSRLGVKVIEADALADLGDLGSPLLFGSYRDPWYKSNNDALSDSTVPNLLPNIRTRPHVRLEFLDQPDDTMHFTAVRSWQLPGWPVAASFPPGGPQLLAVDADGAPDLGLELCWAGGDTASVDANSIFVVKRDGQPLFGSSAVLATLPDLPMQPLAALPAPLGPAGAQGPSLLAVSTQASGPSGGQVWLIDSDPNSNPGQPWPGWPPALPTRVTTPPMIIGEHQGARVIVGCEDGHVYALALDGSVHARSLNPLFGAIRGRLAATHLESIVVTSGSTSKATVAGGDLSGWAIAAGSAGGRVGVWVFDPFSPADSRMPFVSGWPQSITPNPAFAPDFVWIDFDGLGPAGGNPTGCGQRLPELVAHDADRLWAFCIEGRALPGWGHPQSDTLVNALGAGDPDGDGYPEVLVQTPNSRVAFINYTGYPSPGWPRAGSTEGVLHEAGELTAPAPPRSFPTKSPPLALDLDGDRRCEVVAPNTSGLLAALDAQGSIPSGWPLATGAGAGGSAVAADLDRDGYLEIVAPDRHGFLFGYSLPVSAAPVTAHPWTMLGGDPGRTSWLPATRMVPTPAARAGPLIRGSLKAFPNPARMRPVSFAYQLSEPADVEFKILDASGHEVASFSRSGRRSDNLEIWEPGDLPAGLYLARVRFRSPGRDEVQVVPLGLLR